MDLARSSILKVHYTTPEGASLESNLQMGKFKPNRHDCRTFPAHFFAQVLSLVGGGKLDRASSLPPTCHENDACF